MLKVKKLVPHAILPTVGHPGEDLGYDVFASEDTVLPLGVTVAVPTGISARYEVDQFPFGTSGIIPRKFGLLIKDRSSMAAKGIKTSAGVVDAGYTGELKVLMTNTNWEHTHKYCGLNGYDINPDYPYCTETRFGYLIRAGDKIAQMIPTEVFTAGTIIEVEELGQTSRGEGGFGSTGT